MPPRRQQVLINLSDDEDESPGRQLREEAQSLQTTEELKRSASLLNAARAAKPVSQPTAPAAATLRTVGPRGTGKLPSRPSGLKRPTFQTAKLGAPVQLKGRRKDPYELSASPEKIFQVATLARNSAAAVKANSRRKDIYELSASPEPRAPVAPPKAASHKVAKARKSNGDYARLPRTTPAGLANRSSSAAPRGAPPADTGDRATSTRSDAANETSARKSSRLDGEEPDISGIHWNRLPENSLKPPRSKRKTTEEYELEPTRPSKSPRRDNRSASVAEPLPDMPPRSPTQPQTTTAHPQVVISTEESPSALRAQSLVAEDQEQVVDAESGAASEGAQEEEELEEVENEDFTTTAGHQEELPDMEPLDRNADTPLAESENLIPTDTPKQSEPEAVEEDIFSTAPVHQEDAFDVEPTHTAVVETSPVEPDVRDPNHSDIPRTPEPVAEEEGLSTTAGHQEDTLDLRSTSKDSEKAKSPEADAIVPKRRGRPRKIPAVVETPLVEPDVQDPIQIPRTPEPPIEEEDLSTTAGNQEDTLDLESTNKDIDKAPSPEPDAIIPKRRGRPPGSKKRTVLAEPSVLLAKTRSDKNQRPKDQPRKIPSAHSERAQKPVEEEVEVTEEQETGVHSEHEEGPIAKADAVTPKRRGRPPGSKDKRRRSAPGSNKRVVRADSDVVPSKSRSVEKQGRKDQPQKITDVNSKLVQESVEGIEVTQGEEKDVRSKHGDDVEQPHGEVNDSEEDEEEDQEDDVVVDGAEEDDDMLLEGGTEKDDDFVADEEEDDDVYEPGVEEDDDVPEPSVEEDEGILESEVEEEDNDREGSEDNDYEDENDVDRILRFSRTGEREGYCQTKHGKGIWTYWDRGRSLISGHGLSLEEVDDICKHLSGVLDYVHRQKGSERRKAFQDDAFGHIFFAFACFFDVVHDYQQAGEPIAPLPLLRAVVPLMESILLFHKSILEWGLDRQQRLVKKVERQFIGPLRKVRRQYQLELDHLEQAERRRERAERAEQERQRELEEAEAAERLIFRRERWQYLHLQRQRCEPEHPGLEGRARHRLRIQHLFYRNFENQVERDANGDELERVAIFRDRLTPYPTSQLDEGVWTPEQEEALEAGLRKHAGPHVFEKIFKEYCRPGRPLRDFNVSEITAKAASFKYGATHLCQSERQDVPKWIQQIPVLP